jgi:hypothetical protein
LAALKDSANLVASCNGIFVSEVPRGVTYPLVVITPVSSEVMNTLDGEVENLSRFSVQVDLWAKGYSKAMSMTWDAKQGMASSSTFNSVLTASRYDYDVDNSLHRFSLDFSIWH